MNTTAGSILATIFGACLALLLFAAAGLFGGLLALSVAKPFITTPVIIVVFASVLFLSLWGLRKTGSEPSFPTGFVIGSIIGSLLCGLCSTIIAAGSSGGLNFR